MKLDTLNTIRYALTENITVYRKGDEVELFEPCCSPLLSRLWLWIRGYEKWISSNGDCDVEKIEAFATPVFKEMEKQDELKAKTAFDDLKAAIRTRNKIPNPQPISSPKKINPAWVLKIPPSKPKRSQKLPPIVSKGNNFSTLTPLEACNYIVKGLDTQSDILLYPKDKPLTRAAVVAFLNKQIQNIYPKIHAPHGFQRKIDKIIADQFDLIIQNNGVERKDDGSSPVLNSIIKNIGDMLIETLLKQMNRHDPNLSEILVQLRTRAASISESPRPLLPKARLRSESSA